MSKNNGRIRREYHFISSIRHHKNERTSAVIGNDLMNEYKIVNMEKKECTHERREKETYKRIKKKPTVTCRNMTRF